MGSPTRAYLRRPLEGELGGDKQIGDLAGGVRLNLARLPIRHAQAVVVVVVVEMRGESR